MSQPSGMRWWIVVLGCLGTIIDYLSRNALGVMAPELKSVLDLSTREYSYVVGAFQVGYLVMQPVCGLILDSIGLRAGVAIFICISSFSGVLHGFAGGWLSLAALRAVKGAADAVAIPAGMKIVSEWFPHREKSVAVGYFNAGTSLGSLFAPPVVIFLVRQYGWQSAFAITGGLGFVWSVIWYLAYRSPARYIGMIRVRAKSGNGYLQITSEPNDKIRHVGKILRERGFWAIAQARFFAEPVWQTLIFWVPLYLATERHMDLRQIAMFAWLPFLAADLGGLFGGYLSPFVTERFHISLVASRVVGVALGAVLMLGPACIGLTASPYQAIALFCVGGFAHQMISVLLNTLSTDLFEPGEVGTAAGMIGMFASLGGLGFSLLLGLAADKLGYGIFFAAFGAYDLIGAALLIVLLRGTRTFDNILVW
ncbi:hexuronate transporter [Burkholderia sp. MSMB1078WGS]|uniref:MFS transporter n=1 Tax=Burkholderia sp. MSMB1078WGS TaxID=1637900 RepID=UPI00075C70FD|nr:MFS transporter [Burkholderia sp. MSMB1078WGS]KVT09378.1 hexuronate transporter [Burkholderia sp. MSMB1078WGS]